MRLIPKGNFSAGRVPYPIIIAEDTTYLRANFSQPTPHTGIFAVAPGVRLVFGDPADDSKGCNLVNVTVPEGAETYRCNTGQLNLRVPTGGSVKPPISRTTARRR